MTNQRPTTPKPVAINIGESWYNTSFIEEVVEELQQKALSVAAGHDIFTVAEQFAYHVIKDNTSYFDVQPTSPNQHH